MAPIGERKKERKVAKLEHVRAEAEQAAHIAQAVNAKRDPNSELRNPPLVLPPIVPVLSQKLASVKEELHKTAVLKESAKNKVEKQIADKVAANATPVAKAPVWTPNKPA